MSSDDEAPDAFSFSVSKKAAIGEAQALNEFHANEKKKLKDRRRARDRTLKERKAQSQVGKSPGKPSVKGRRVSERSESEGGGTERRDKSGSELEDRMARAMREAEEESDEEGEELDSQGDDLGSDMEDIEEDASEDSEDESEEDEAMDSDSEEDEEEDEVHETSSKRLPGPSSSKKLDYLPEHIFAEAFSQSPSTLSSQAKGKGKLKQDNTGLASKNKRKRPKRTAKDIAIGARTIRTLSKVQTDSPVSLPKTLKPPSQMNHFITRSLNLRGEASGARLRGWERRPANVGVMKRLGPAAQFVRS